MIHFGAPKEINSRLGVSLSRGGLGEKFSPGIFSPDQPTTLLALGVGGDEREEPISE